MRTAVLVNPMPDQPVSTWCVSDPAAAPSIAFLHPDRSTESTDRPDRSVDRSVWTGPDRSVALDRSRRTSPFGPVQSSDALTIRLDPMCFQPYPHNFFPPSGPDRFIRTTDRSMDRTDVQADLVQIDPVQTDQVRGEITTAAP